MFHNSLAAIRASKKEYSNVKRSDFPNDFLFGASTAAAQIEGSAKSEGKGPSVWDHFVREFPDKIADKSNLDIAADSYNRYKEDVSNLKDLSVDSYRFSIAWTRIFPGIKPFVTLMHFDEPEALVKKYGGFLSHRIANDFRDYAEICFKSFGDRVKNWITINEPYIMAKMGYVVGVGPPGRCSNRKFCPSGNSTTEPYIVGHNLLLAHATAAKLYKQKYQATQGGQIGMSLVAQYYEPYSNTSLDKKAARRGMDFEFGWFVDPLVRGKYPKTMRKLVKERLPVFSAKEKELVKGSFDFIGINYYSSRYAKNIPSSPNAMPVVDSRVNITVNKDGVPIGPNAGGSKFIYIYPKGLYKVLKYIKKHYGYTEKSDNYIPMSKTLKDESRIKFVQKHLHQLRKAIKKGVDVKGYFYYSLIDSFEWGEGYTVRYGLYYVDFKTLTRSPKKSAKWYHGFIKGVTK
ncbi:hypothetical protein V6N13_018553 [Hibiscus sabdariffa]